MFRAVVDRDSLTETLSRAGKIVARLGKNSFLNPGALLKVEGNYLSVYATDMDNWMLQRLGIYEGEEGQAFVPVKNLITLLKDGGGEAITLEKEDSTLHVRMGDRSEYRIRLFNDEEFPALPDISVGEGVMVDTERFVKNVEKVVWCASKDDPRPMLTGVYVHVRGDELRFVASDGSILGFYAQRDFSGNVEFLLPAYAYPLLKTLPKGNGIISVKEGHIRFSVDGENVSTTLSVRGIDERYVDYESIVPTEFVCEVVVDAEELKRSVNRVMSVAPDTYEIDVEAERNVLRLRSMSAMGEGRETLEAEVRGEISVRILGSHISGVLKHLEGEKVHFRFSGENTPVMIGPYGEDNHFYLTLPIATS